MQTCEDLGQVDASGEGVMSTRYDLPNIRSRSGDARSLPLDAFARVAAEEEAAKGEEANL